MEQQQLVFRKYNGGRWSNQDEKRVFKMTLNGYPDSWIANRLNRTEKAVQARRHLLRDCGQWTKWLNIDNLGLWLLCEEVRGDFDDI